MKRWIRAIVLSHKVWKAIGELPHSQRLTWLSVLDSYVRDVKRGGLNDFHLFALEALLSRIQQ